MFGNPRKEIEICVSLLYRGSVGMAVTFTHVIVKFPSWCGSVTSSEQLHNEGQGKGTSWELLYGTPAVHVLVKDIKHINIDASFILYSTNVYKPVNEWLIVLRSSLSISVFRMFRLL